MKKVLVDVSKPVTLTTLYVIFKKSPYLQLVLVFAIAYELYNYLFKGKGYQLMVTKKKNREE